MNPDRIIGTAVLVTSGAHHWLHYLKVGRNIEGTSWDDLPMLPEGAAKPAEKLPSHFPENNPWRYRIEGETIHVHPSVNQGDNYWHNDGAWSVRFVLATGTSRTEHLTQLASVNPAADTVRLREVLK